MVSRLASMDGMKRATAAKQIGITPAQLRRLTRGVTLPSQTYRRPGTWRTFAPLDLFYVRLVNELVRFNHPLRAAHISVGAILDEMFPPGANPTAETILRRTRPIVLRFTQLTDAVPALSLRGVAEEIFVP